MYLFVVKADVTKCHVLAVKPTLCHFVWIKREVELSVLRQKIRCSAYITGFQTFTHCSTHGNRSFSPGTPVLLNAGMCRCSYSAMQRRWTQDNKSEQSLWGAVSNDKTASALCCHLVTKNSDGGRSKSLTIAKRNVFCYVLPSAAQIKEKAKTIH